MFYTKEEYKLVREVKLLCDEKGVTPLVLFFTGSRQYGYAKADSDYDVLFVFKRPVEDYLKVTAPIDEIKVPDKDVKGWDVRKFCSVLAKSGWNAFEAIHSKRYDFDWRLHGEARFYNHLDNFIKESGIYDPYKVAKTMIGCSNRDHTKYVTAEGNKKMKYFLSFSRMMLSAKYCMTHDTYPPLNVLDLVKEVYHDDAMLDFFYDVMMKRAEGVEEVDPAILTGMDSYATMFLQMRDSMAEELKDVDYKEKSQKNLDALDRLVVQTLN